MTPETREHLDKAREYHAAQALISEKTGRIAKTHEGVNRQFHALTKGDPRVDAELRRFLSQAYTLKAVADYEAGVGANVPFERAEAALASAQRFVDCVAVMLTGT